MSRQALILTIFLLAAFCAVWIVLMRLAPLQISLTPESRYPTPAPTHTPVPTPTPTAMPAPTVGPGAANHFRTGVSRETTLAADNTATWYLRQELYSVSARNLQFPHCLSAEGDTDNSQQSAEYEYFWILLQPAGTADATTGARLRGFSLDGFAQRGVFGDGSRLTVAGQVYNGYRTVNKQRCGGAHQGGWGDAAFTIAVSGGG